MNRTDKDFVAFEKAMDETGIYRRTPDFVEICLIIGADPVSLDRRIYEDLGWCGQELVGFYRRVENIQELGFRK